MATETCSVCGVEIEGDLVKFSYGNPGSRDRLRARVCVYAKKPGCINDPAAEVVKAEAWKPIAPIGF